MLVAIPVDVLPVPLVLTLLNVVVEDPPIVGVVPLKLIVEPVLVKVVPLLYQLPATLCVKDPAVKLVPLPKVKDPVMLKAATAVVETVPLKLKLLPIAVVPLCRTSVPLPLNVKL